MAVSRRTFLKGSAAAAGGAAVASQVIRFDQFETLAPRAATDAAAPHAIESVPSECWIGKQDCGLFARKDNGRVIKLEGNPASPRNGATLCPKGVAQITALYDPNRVTTPLVRTNEKGRSGEWREVTWDDAIKLAAAKIKETRDKDPSQVLWQKGRSKSEPLYDNAFVKSLKADKLGHGTYCSDAGYRALEYTIGVKGVLEPDFKHTEYVLAWGWNLTNAGGNKYCWITWNQLFVEARERGIKVISIDPRARAAGPHADEWLPIRPGTDLALALAFSNVLIASGTIDRDYLTKNTNATSLVRPDGSLLKIDGAEAVWDSGAGRAVPRGGAAGALEGSYSYQGEDVKPAFEVFKAQVAKNTPDWASEICGIDAKTIDRIGKEIGSAARIGSTISIDGKSLPHRPVGVMHYHAAQQELGFQAVRAMTNMLMMIGALGAPGGTLADPEWKVSDSFKTLDEIQIKDKPSTFYLKGSKYYPINSGNPGVGARVMADPAKYGVTKVPEVMILHYGEPLRSFASRPDFEAAYPKYKFVVALSPWLGETIDYYADLILPVATMEKYEGPSSLSSPYVSATGLRVPVMEPMGQSKGEIEIYLDLAEGVGTLLGKDGYIDLINKELKIKDPYLLPLDKKPAVREIFDRWAKSEGIEEGVAYFEKNGVKVKGPIAPSKIYGAAVSPAFGGVTLRFYGDSLLRYQHQMKAMGAAEMYWQDYTPLPKWRAPTMDKSPAEYDLTLISYKTVEHKQSRTIQLPLLTEQMPMQRAEINAETAGRYKIKDGDEIWVESHNALTGETRRVKTVAYVSEAIRPDTLGMYHHFGGWTHPWSKDTGPTPNEIFFTGEGYVGMTADQSFQVKVKVYRA